MPIPANGQVEGLLVVEAAAPGARARLVEQLPVLSDLAAFAGSLLAPGLEGRRRASAVAGAIRQTIAAGAFSPVFQPIVELASGAVVGYEALTRFADGTPPDALFAAARAAGLGLELEVATLEAALAAETVLPAGTYLSLNASPELILSGRLAPLLATRTRQLVLEVTEHVVIEDYTALRRAFAALEPPVRLAVDDVGAGYASLRHVLELAPDFVKLDGGLVRGVDADLARQALIVGIGYFAVRRKIWLIAEAIETTAELATLRALGIPYGQGYLFGHPQDGRGSGPWPTHIRVSTHDGDPG